jgi:hypothetical protein
MKALSGSPPDGVLGDSGETWIPFGNDKREATSEREWL